MYDSPDPKDPPVSIYKGRFAKYCLGLGAAYGTAKSGIGIAGVGTFRPDLIMKVYQRASTSFSTSPDNRRSV